MKNGKLSFGIAAIAAGQKSAIVNARPQLIARSTSGGFSITAPVSKALNIAVGDNVMFLNNIASINAAIAQKPQDLVDWAAENGVDLDSPEGAERVVDEFGQWYIAKGVAMFDSKGNPVMARDRYSKADKEKFIKEHAMEIVDANRDALKERLGNPDATDEELAASITVDDVESPTHPAYSGSKTATTSAATGVGCQLNFTDSAIWASLKKDLGDEADKKVRVFDVDLNAPETAAYNNGHEEVGITVYPITFSKDSDPIQRNANSKETAE